MFRTSHKTFSSPVPVLGKRDPKLDSTLIFISYNYLFTYVLICLLIYYLSVHVKFTYVFQLL